MDLKHLVEIFDAITVGIHIVDHEGITRYYNKSCEQIEGNRKKRIINRDMHDLVKEGVYSESVALKSIVTKRPYATTQRVNDKYIYSSATPIFDHNQLIYTVISVLDITRLEELEMQCEDLKAVNEKIQLKLEALAVRRDPDVPLVFKSKEMEGIMTFAKRVAQVDSNILIEGESGVGKGVLSKWIQENSKRKNGPFMTVDCSSLTESLIEAELFGYEEGAFTGAKKAGKLGLLELSDGGTLFLDEIGELPLALQAKLLRVIQEKVIQRVGGTELIPVNTRIIAATNRDLLQMVKNKEFREDLYYRLRVVPIHLPPLRQRKEDIVPLVKHFMEKVNEEYRLDKTISPEGLKTLMNYPWPGNVRELENEIERVMVTVDAKRIEKHHLSLERGGSEEDLCLKEGKSYKEHVMQYEEKLLRNFLKISNDISHLSELTGLEKSTIRKKAKRLGVKLEY